MLYKSLIFNYYGRFIVIRQGGDGNLGVSDNDGGSLDRVSVDTSSSDVTNILFVVERPGSKTPGPTPAPTTLSGTSPAPGPSKTCSNNERVSFEDFETRNLAGWTNGRVDYCPYFTNFLGRYGRKWRCPAV
jgi:hypothetical protein